MRVELQPGFLLHRRGYRETSLLLEVFTAQHGCVALVAKGALRPRSDAGAQLHPFRPLLLSWTERGGELGTLTRCEGPGASLLREGEPLLCGFYLNELILRSMHRHDPHPDVYRDYERTVRALADGSGQVEVILRTFERELLQGLGYGMILDRDVASGERIAAAARYHYHPGQGPTAAGSSGAGAIPVSGAALLGLASGQFADALALADAKRLMRALLRLYIGDKPLTSRAWFQSY